MIVNNKGYLKLDDIKILSGFSIYETRKKTHILVKDAHADEIHLYFAKEDRVPYKLVEGKKICIGIKVFDSKINNINELDLSKFNNGNQIMSYQERS